MTFRQCVIIALAFHLALMLYPLKEHMEGEKRNVVLVVTEKPGILATSVEEAREDPLPQPVQQESLHDKKKDVQLPQPVNQEVLKDTKEEVQPAPSIVKPEKPAVENVCRKKPVQNKQSKQENPAKDVRHEPEISRPTVPLRSEPEIDVVTKSVVPESPILHREVRDQSAPVIETSTGKAVIDKPLEVAFGSDEGPRFKRRILPEYPRKARRLGKTGTVVLVLTIDAEGKLVDVEILKKGGHGFDEAAIAAVKSSLFMAARRDGKPFACKAVLPVRFKLR